MSHRTLKRIALITMIIDHIGAFIPGAPIWLRYIGRISAPIFFFCCAHSLEHTKDKRKFAIRLYLFSLLMIFGNVILDVIFGFREGVPEDNIFLTLFVGVMAVLLYEKYKAGGIAIFCLYQVGAYFLCDWIYSINSIRGNAWHYFLYIIPGITWSAYEVEYGVAFVLLFILMYYTKDNPMLLSALVITCSFCIYKVSHRFLSPFFRTAVGFWDMQYLMIFCLPIILLYNGKKGKGSKYFYYLFYPLHLWAFYIVQQCVFFKK